MRKPLMVLAIAVLLVLTVIGGLLPFLQGWIFFVLALYLLATEFESGRIWVKRARRQWPALSRWISAAQRTASTTLGNSTRIPSPVFLTMRPRCSSIFGSIS